MAHLTYKGDDCHVAYRNLIRDSDDESGQVVKRIRKEISEMWTMFRRFADPHFKSEFYRNPIQRYWEMYLGCALLDRGVMFNNPLAQGPDFCIDLNGQKVWIEAVTPNTGVSLGEP